MSSKTAVLSVRIVSDAKRANEGFKRAGNAGDKFGQRMRKMATGVVSALGFKKITKELFDMGAMFDRTWDNLRVGTGATGDALAELQDSVRAVADEVPAMDGGIEQIGTTLGDVNTRLGLTGPELERVTGQFVTLSNLGVDADINKVGQAMNSFGVEAGDVEGELDKLFQISQSTGLSISDLAGSAVKGGPQLRQYGFELDEAATMMGLLDKAGIDADGTVRNMQRALGEFAEAGRDAPEALRETITEIDNFIEAGDMAAAYDMAENLFGTRGATRFIDAVQEGTLTMEDFGAAAGLTDDTIMGLGEEVASFPEKWQQFKQSAQLALEPLATLIFDSLSGPLETAGQFMSENQGIVMALTAAIGGFVGSITAARVGMALFNAVMNANPIARIISLVIAVGAALVVAYNESETFRNFIDALWDVAQRVFTRIGEAVSKAAEAFQPLLNVIGNVIDWISQISFPSPPDWMTNLFGVGGGVDDVMGIPARPFHFMAPPPDTFGAGPDLTAAPPPSFFGGSGGLGTAAGTGGAIVDNSVTVNVDGSGIVDARRVAEQIRDALAKDSRTRGGAPAAGRRGGARPWR